MGLLVIDEIFIAIFVADGFGDVDEVDAMIVIVIEMELFAKEFVITLAQGMA